MMRLIPEYAPVSSLHLCFVHRFFNERFHHGKAICEIIHNAHPFVDVEVWIDPADLPFFQEECAGRLDGTKRFHIFLESSGRGFATEASPIFAEDVGKRWGLVFRTPKLDAWPELKQFAYHFMVREGFSPLELPFDFDSTKLLATRMWR